jgi:peptidoglycan/xylan/chitin deacetylase (PgdA/CDA1 family)
MRALAHLLAPVAPGAAGALGVPRRLPFAAGAVLTFDDGPHPDGTPAVLERLAQANVQAVFFVVGEQVQRRPAVVAEIVAGGHVVALHGFRHRFQPRLPPAQVRADLERGRAAIEDAIGATPTWHRPPYGAYSPAGLAAVRALGLQPLLWSRWGKDWRRFTTPARIAARATRDVAAGDVILLHDADFYSASGSHWKTVRALGRIIWELKEKKIDTVLPV